MAMEVTHVRFARDLKEFLDIEDLDAYYSGSVYPDSRYFTGIDRKLTHGENNPVNPFIEGLSDFEKGWASHFMYDRLAKPYYLKLSPYSDDQLGFNNPFWQFSTAEKLIEDMESWQQLGEDHSIITDLRVYERPRGEDPALLEEYYEALRTSYLKHLSLDVYVEFWKSINLNEDIIKALTMNVELILSDESLVKRIHDIYPSVLKEAKLLAEK